MVAVPTSNGPITVLSSRFALPTPTSTPATTAKAKQSWKVELFKILCAASDALEALKALSLAAAFFPDLLLRLTKRSPPDLPAFVKRLATLDAALPAALMLLMTAPKLGKPAVSPSTTATRCCWIVTM